MRAVAPVVSAVVTTYNHERFIGEALRGILEQRTSHAFEIVVGVDLSEDGTADVVREVERESAGVVRPTFHAERQGLMENLRQAYAAARGKYVAILDGDDFWCHPEKLQRQIEALESDPAIAICGHLVEQRTVGGEVRDPIPVVSYEPVSPGETFLERLCDLHLSSMLFRQIFPGGLPREFLDPRARVPDLGIKVALAGRGGVAFIPEVWSVFRRVPGSVSWDLSYEAPEWRLAVARGLRNARRFLPADLRPVLDRLVADQFLGIAMSSGAPLRARCLGAGRAMTVAPRHAVGLLAKRIYAAAPEPAKKVFRSLRGASGVRPTNAG